MVYTNFPNLYSSAASSTIVSISYVEAFVSVTVRNSRINSSVYFLMHRREASLEKHMHLKSIKSYEKSLYMASQSCDSPIATVCKFSKSREKYIFMLKFIFYMMMHSHCMPKYDFMFPAKKKTLSKGIFILFYICRVCIHLYYQKEQIRLYVCFFEENN